MFNISSSVGNLVISSSTWHAIGAIQLARFDSIFLDIKIAASFLLGLEKKFVHEMSSFPFSLLLEENHWVAGSTELFYAFQRSYNYYLYLNNRSLDEIPMASQIEVGIQ